MNDLPGLLRQLAETPLGQFHLVDVVDVLVVTALVYTVIALVRATQAGLVAVGLLLLAVLYVVASAFGLTLTAAVLGGFFAIAVVIVVVIFAPELRQLFERLAVWSLRGRRERPPRLADFTDDVVAALADMARSRTGALIVLPGRDPIWRHVHGGIPLDGRVSVPLLLSIFDPHSAGHDGAVVIERGQVSRFAVHLPLSQDLEQLTGCGTRHAAALGLAEQTDAVCLVVSEERGQLSVAAEGRLARDVTPEAAAAFVRRLARDPEDSAGRAVALRRLVLRNWPQKLTALALVAGVWFVVVPGSRPTDRTFPARVNVVNVPPDLRVAAIEPAQVDVTLAGMRRDFYLFDPGRLEVSLDAGAARPGRRSVEITDRQLRFIPTALTPQRLQPSSVRVTFGKKPETPPAE
jgi:diadenylate cyclase